MSREIRTKQVGGLTAYYRPGLSAEGSSDEHALEEVLVKKCYRRVRNKFDVLPGERWLDLGANIGSFALYALERGGHPFCYEPDPDCFNLLKMNAPQAVCHNVAVTASMEPELTFFSSKNPDNRYRGTVVPVERYQEEGRVANLWAGHLLDRKFDGIKMDIEGSEGPLIDAWLIPPCKKLVMEYHTSRDSSVENLARRLRILKSKFEHVAYPSEYAKVIASGETHYKPRVDKLIFCWGPK